MSDKSTQFRNQKLSREDISRRNQIENSEIREIQTKLAVTRVQFEKQISKEYSPEYSNFYSKTNKCSI